MKTLVRMVGLVAVPLLGLALAAALVSGCPKATPASAGSAGELAWIYNLDYGLKQAAKHGKPVMVDFYADWCGWCQKLDEDTYSDARVREKAGRFVAVKVDADRDGASLRKYGVEGFPTVLFLSPEGKEIRRVPGYAPPEAFLKEMDRALSKAEKA
jgi:thiol:disulfide interchange protein